MEEERADQAGRNEMLTRACLERDPTRKLYFATQAITLNPDDQKAWIERGKALMKCGMLKEAQEQIDEVITHNPDDGEGWYLHGLLMSMMGKRDLAKESLDKATGTLKNPSPAQYALGNLLFLDGDYEEALRLFDATIREDSRDPDAWYARGRVLFKMKRYHQAVTSFDHVLEIWPDDPGAEDGRRRAIRILNQDQNRTDDRDFDVLREEADYGELIRILTYEKSSKALKAARILIALGTGSTPFIRPLLSHNDPEVRHRALHILLAIGDTRCADIFIRVALTIRTPEEGGGKRSSALLNEIGTVLKNMGVDITSALEETLQSGDEVKTIRAIRLLERAGGSSCILHLLSATGHSSVRVIFAALTALAPIGDERAINRISDLLKSPDPIIRERAQAALRQIIRRSLPAIMKQYAKGNATERAYLLDLLHIIGGELIPQLLKTLSYEDDPIILEAASDALAAAADYSAITPLIKALASPDEHIHQALSRAFRNVGAPAVKPLIQHLFDPRRRVRDLAGEILANMGRTSIPALIGAIESGEQNHIEVASRVLVMIGREAVSALNDALLIHDDPVFIEEITGIISLIRKKERMERLLAEYRCEEPI
ncbi:HEAT repeat domain-containing protein [Methanocalculus sp.]|uniref:HEAT repeat domain-containing protein n=1 Tax=Methanocalculus sp. TaxID=2004547 RepID=UPI002723F492|nr:HEAT repeat domain-containing protein [Methanocalculus sp.]MDO8841305.1 HEAT repeat domain-containing protein [Methanocalculus sp.]